MIERTALSGAVEHLAPILRQSPQWSTLELRLRGGMGFDPFWTDEATSYVAKGRCSRHGVAHTAVGMAGEVAGVGVEFTFAVIPCCDQWICILGRAFEKDSPDTETGR